MILEMRCEKCRVSDYCPSKGSSPGVLKNGKHALCRLVGGYGRKTLPEKILSKESKELSANGRNCLTIAEIPIILGNDVFYKIEKIFSPPVLHERESLSWHQKMLMPKRKS